MPDVRYCDCHPAEKKTMYLLIPIKDENGITVKIVSQKIVLDKAPTPIGNQSIFPPLQLCPKALRATEISRVCSQPLKMVMEIWLTFRHGR